MTRTSLITKRYYNNINTPRSSSSVCPMCQGTNAADYHADASSLNTFVSTSSPAPTATTHTAPIIHALPANAASSSHTMSTSSDAIHKPHSPDTIRHDHQSASSSSTATCSTTTTITPRPQIGNVTAATAHRSPSVARKDAVAVSTRMRLPSALLSGTTVQKNIPHVPSLSSKYDNKMVIDAHAVTTADPKKSTAQKAPSHQHHQALHARKTTTNHRSTAITTPRNVIMTPSRLVPLATVSSSSAHRRQSRHQQVSHAIVDNNKATVTPRITSSTTPRMMVSSIVTPRGGWNHSANTLRPMLPAIAATAASGSASLRHRYPAASSSSMATTTNNHHRSVADASPLFPPTKDDKDESMHHLLMQVHRGILASSSPRSKNHHDQQQSHSSQHHPTTSRPTKSVTWKENDILHMIEEHHDDDTDKDNRDQQQQYYNKATDHLRHDGNNKDEQHSVDETASDDVNVMTARTPQSDGNGASHHRSGADNKDVVMAQYRMDDSHVSDATDHIRKGDDDKERHDKKHRGVDTYVGSSTSIQMHHHNNRDRHDDNHDDASNQHDDHALSSLHTDDTPLHISSSATFSSLHDTDSRRQKQGSKGHAFRGKRMVPSHVSEGGMLSYVPNYSSSVWDTIHAFAFSYSDRPSAEERRHARQFYEAIAYLFPCQLCREHYSDMIRREGYRVDASNRDALSRWSVRIHNAVNARLGKPQWSYENARLRWLGY